MLNANPMECFLFPMLPSRSQCQFLSLCWQVFRHYQVHQPANTKEINWNTDVYQAYFKFKWQVSPLLSMESLLAPGLLLPFQVSFQAAAPGCSASPLWPTLPLAPVPGEVDPWHDQELLQQLAGTAALCFVLTRSATPGGSTHALVGCCQ